ncbi:hypothetical protein ES703_60920 [subsurface metagenome]
MGFNIFEASTAPSAAPAPTTVCSSSRNKIILPSALDTSFSTAFNLSSNSPLYLEPATRAPISRAIIFLSLRPSGTSPDTILLASPSTMAVLPTPGSPIRTGLFLVLLDSTCTTLLISSSLPITGSSFPFLARSVMSFPNFLSAWYLSSGFWSVILWLPLMLTRIWYILSLVTPYCFKSCPTFPELRAREIKICSVETYSSFNCSASLKALFKMLFNSELIYI